MKQCKKCGQFKEDTEYKPRKGAKGSVSLICLQCKNDIYLPWRGNSPLPLTVVFSVKCFNAGEAERLLHVKFKERHAHGEWFELSGENIQEAIAYANTII